MVLTAITNPAYAFEVPGGAAADRKQQAAEHFWGVLHPGHVLVKTNQHPHLRPSGGVSDQLDEGFFKFFVCNIYTFSIFVLSDYLNYFQIFVDLKTRCS